MLLYLDLIENGAINIDFLTENIFGIEESEVAMKPLSLDRIYLSYLIIIILLIRCLNRGITEKENKEVKGNKVALGIIGAGSFVVAYLLTLKNLMPYFRLMLLQTN